jgi:hypothetical protein
MKDLTELLEDWTIAKEKLKLRLAALADKLTKAKQEELIERLEIRLKKRKEYIQA